MSDDSAGGGGADDGVRQDFQPDSATYHSSVHQTPQNLSKDEREAKPGLPQGKSNGTRAVEQKSNTDKGVTSWFAIPAPLKRVFDRFPLVAYRENELPTPAFRKRGDRVLYVFTTAENALSERPSFNPSCLKWQTYLKMAGLPFRTASSNNHASPSGNLPFLLVHNTGNSTHSHFTSALSLPELVPGSRLKTWTRDRIAEDGMQEPNDIRYEAYASLLDNRVRKAWLYQLYLHPANEAVVKRLYVRPCTSNPFVQVAIASQLRSAAESEIIKASIASSSTSWIDEKEILRDAEDAFRALSTVLGDEPWFFCDGTRQQSHGKTKDGPSLFDASVFAYTHLILDYNAEGEDGLIEWKENSLRAVLERFKNLVKHRERVLELYY